MLAIGSEDGVIYDQGAVTATFPTLRTPTLTPLLPLINESVMTTPRGR